MSSQSILMILRKYSLWIMPKDSFTRTNGGATEEYNIGNYKGNTYGKCMLFIWNGYGPVVMIKGDNKDSIC